MISAFEKFHGAVVGGLQHRVRDPAEAALDGARGHLLSDALAPLVDWVPKDGGSEEDRVCCIEGGPYVLEVSAAPGSTRGSERTKVVGEEDAG